jgi:serine/threonine protein kinase
MEPESTTTPPKADGGSTKSVMGKYQMSMAREAIMGVGKFSICRRGTDANGNEVAIKVYKEQVSKGGKLGGTIRDKTLQKFKRQVEVLQKLMEPLQKPSDPTLWDESLAQVKPGHVFMRMLDYSKTSEGKPGPDPADGVLYVVTELGQCTLKEFLAQRHARNTPLSKDEVQRVSKSILIAMASLHAKGFVHFDMKPENMMYFNGKLKVIDVEGCKKVGTKVSIQDPSVSFSAGHCAPEWARFVLDDHQPNIIIANPALDAWSVGVTLCQLVNPDASLKPQDSWTRSALKASSDREANVLSLEWLGGIKNAPLPKSVLDFDPGFLDLLSGSLLVCNAKNRMTCAQALSHAFIKASKWDADSVKTDKLNMNSDKNGPRRWLSSEITESTAAGSGASMTGSSSSFNV